MGTNDEWRTPPEVFDPVLKALGIKAFGLDPFGHPKSLLPRERQILLPQYGLRAGPNDIVGNAFDYDWSGHGTVFVNGPFSNCTPVAEQMHGEKGGDEVVCLWPARTGAIWWQNWVTPSDGILFWRGRIRFVGAEHIAPFHCALSYVGPRAELFVEGMREYGWMVRNRRDWST
jgi:hypothetical protein